MSLRGQSSGDFKEFAGRVQPFYVVTRNSWGVLSSDGFTQVNPVNGAALINKSSTLTGVTKVGVLGGTVAFTRPDAGNGYHGGPVSGSYVAGVRPLGVFINDSAGNAFENTPGLASGRGPYITGSGSCLGVTIYETKQQVGGSTALTYATGDKLYASINGLLTNRIGDAYERNVGGATDADVTVVGIVKAAPDATTGTLVFDLRI